MLRYKIKLTQEERSELEGILKKGKHSSLEFCNACILLNCDEGEGGEKLSYELIAKVLHVSTKKVERLRQRFMEEGFEACLGRRTPTRVKEIKANSDFEAHLTALSCSKAPDGYDRWSLRMLADKMVELKYVESISHETVRKTLQKMKSNRDGFKVK